MENLDGAAAALKTHSLAEKRRRDRINSHLATLRRMIPNSNKMDKASILAHVIEQVRDLDRHVSDIDKATPIPSLKNQVIVECDIKALDNDCDDKVVHIKATLCCDDRPDLFSKLIKAFHILRLRVLRAELSSMGGRAHNVFTLCRKDENGGLSSLLERLRKVLSRIVSSEEEQIIIPI